MLGKDILALVENIANEKNIPESDVFGVIEHSLEIASRKVVGKYANLRIKIDRETGSYKTYDVSLKDEDDLYNYDTFNDIPDELLKFEEIPNIDLDRIAVQSARQALHQRLRDAEKEAQANSMGARLDSILNLKVSKIYDKYYLLTNIDDLAFILNKSEILPGDSFRIGDKVKVLLSEIKSTKRGNTYFISRTADNFLKELMRIEIPEINEGIIEIKAIARQPGARAKVAVKTNDKRIDPIGACIGMRGSRIQNITSALMGERIDVVEWNDDLAQFVVNAISPIKVKSVFVEQNNNKPLIKLLIEDEQHSQGVGKSGINVNLISKLTNSEIELLSEGMAKKSIDNLIKNFAFILDITEDLAKEIIDLGFDTLESITNLNPDDLILAFEIEEKLAKDIIENARKSILLEDLLKIKSLEPEVFKKLIKKDITTLVELSELSTYDLVDDLGIEEDLASKLISQARKMTGVV